MLNKFDLFSEVIEEEEEVVDLSYDKQRRAIDKDVQKMLYGFGDEEKSCPETVQLLEELVINYVIDMTTKALNIGKVGKIMVDDIMYIVRNDPKKYSRVKELIALNDELNKAKKIFDVADSK